MNTFHLHYFPLPTIIIVLSMERPQRRQLILAAPTYVLFNANLNSVTLR